MNNSGLHKYIEIKNIIIDKINNDIFRAGEIIPSERELIEMFSVSRITVRKALTELQNEGYLYKIQGKGTFVKGQENRQNLFSLTSCTQDIIRLGMTPSRKVLHHGLQPVDENTGNCLNLNKGEPVFSLARIYYADNEPINFTTANVPNKYVEGIDNFDFSKASLYDVLENKYSIKITKAVRTVEAVIASDEIRELLSVKKGVPLLLFKCTTFGKRNGKEIPVERFISYYRSDKFNFFINQVR